MAERPHHPVLHRGKRWPRRVSTRDPRWVVWGQNPDFSLVTPLGPFQGFSIGAFHRPTAKGIWTFTLPHHLHGEVEINSSCSLEYRNKHFCCLCTWLVWMIIISTFPRSPVEQSAQLSL